MNRYSLLLRAATLALAFCLPQLSYAQEQLGMRLERYAGIYSASINPANTADNPNNWEVSLFTAEAFLENNYAYLRNTSLPHALRNSDKIVSILDTSQEDVPPANAILLDYFDRKRKLYAVAQTRLTGPGFSFRFGSNNVIGLTTALRSQLSAYKVPEIYRYRTISNLPRNEAVNMQPAGFAGMVWGEIGLHYSRSSSDGDVQKSWGISPKLLLGLEGFYTRARANFDYTQRLGDTVAFGSANWDYALTLGNAGDTDNTRLRKQGTGMGLDIGYTWASLDVTNENEYTWRLGASLVDLGFVRFNKTSERHHVAFDTLLTIDDTDFPTRNNAEEVLRDASLAFLGDPTASIAGRSFVIGLPTALSLQFDAKVAQHFFVSGLLLQRVPLLRYNVKRPNTLAIVPRFETRWFSFSMPFVLSDWQSLRVGAAARLGWLYIGSDNMGSFFTKDKLTGADIYIGLKINAFSIGFNKGNRLTRESSNKRGRQQRNKIKCYQF